MVFPDAGEFYTKLATLIGSWLPPTFSLTSAVGSVAPWVDAAQIAPDGLAIGFDLSLSKVVRARLISQGRAVLRYSVRDKLEVMDPTKKDLSARVIDIVAPIGKGQRALIVAPPPA